MVTDQVIELPLDQMTAFPEHPFKVCDDEAMQQLVDSIRKVGVLTPVIVRGGGGGKWQIISGHRRVHACKILGMDTVPAIVKKLEMDDAIVMMVDSNFQRKSLLPSEKATAYKKKLDAVKRQGARTDLTSDHDGQKSRGKTSRDMIAEKSPDSSTQIQRFIRLNELIPELLEFVDEGRVAVTPAVELSYLKDEEQMMILLTIESEQNSPSLSQAQRIRKLSEQELLNEEKVLSILSEKKKADCWNLTIPMNRVSRYFPNTYTYQQMQDTIIRLLEGWLRKRKKQAENQGGKKNV